MVSKLQRGECNDFWIEIKALNLNKEYLPLTVGGTSGVSIIANLWKNHFSEISKSVGSTDNRDQVINALGTVPAHKRKVKSAMATSLPVENLLLQNVGSIINYLQ